MKTNTRKTLSRPADFVSAGMISAQSLDEIDRVAQRYALALTADLAELVQADNARDPVARQFVPSSAELDTKPQESTDPIADEANSPVAGIVHRYPDRVLLMPTHLCAVYCRFCFRRETVGRQRSLSRSELATAIGYIRNHQDVWEVILSGGDPLILSPRRLKAITDALAKIDHVNVIRVHTRVPVADPDRVTPALIQALKATGKATYVALHVNHARELGPKARIACARLVDSGIPMLSQTVLLRGINDDATTLSELMRSLVECRVKPYYLHHGDLAPGTAHWRTSIEQGQSIMRSIRGRLSGLCQPTYVLDIPGGHGKSPIGPCYVSCRNNGASCHFEVEDFQGRRHSYPPEA